ncbi:hypothetical protein [Paenibacillus eucommiae]|uniref:Dehydrogenase n=1 Tax=Paenibacillus eucommiae TaxID=1355755 RepID=A0ABS4IRR1_9BACL|nr:hypothetical protein [Paenibacillus eucommiae]MBP1990223.1 putative dehydrogenase [Paenibacillus eucommiae]
MQSRSIRSSVIMAANRPMKAAVLGCGTMGRLHAECIAKMNHVELAGFFARPSKMAVEDAGIVHVAYRGGQTAVLDTSWSRGGAFPAGDDLTIEIIGNNGMISIDVFA